MLAVVPPANCFRTSQQQADKAAPSENGLSDSIAYAFRRLPRINSILSRPVLHVSRGLLLDRIAADGIPFMQRRLQRAQLLVDVIGMATSATGEQAIHWNLDSRIFTEWPNGWSDKSFRAQNIIKSLLCLFSTNKLKGVLWQKSATGMLHSQQSPASPAAAAAATEQPQQNDCQGSSAEVHEMLFSLELRPRLL